MLIPTRAESVAQEPNLVDGKLSPEAIADARALVRLLPEYRTDYYPELDTKLEAVEGYEAQQILAALARVDALDQDMDLVEVTGLLKSNENNDRIEWARFIGSVLFDGKSSTETIAVGPIDPPALGFCSYCLGSGCYRCF